MTTQPMTSPARSLLRATSTTLQPLALSLALLAGLAVPGARAEVTITNLSVAQRPGTKLVDITYDVANTATNGVSVTLSVKNGATVIPTPSATGHIGPGVLIGTRRAIVWNGAADANGLLLQNIAVSVNAVSTGWVPDTYLVIDLSGGASATNYPVSYLSAVPVGGWTDAHKTTKLVLRRVPAGSFTMGSPTGEEGRSANDFSEDPQHEVTLTKDFYIGVFEVTQRQWELVMGNKPSYFNNASYYAKRPVETVSYYEIRENPANSEDPTVTWPANSAVNATSFMGKLRAKTGIATIDLPTESQWEYACRAGTTTALNSGKNLTNSTSSCPNMNAVGRNGFNGGSRSSSSEDCTPSAGTALVGSYQPNQWGLYDMHGNVFEWCLDWYNDYPYHGAVSDPDGGTTGNKRVTRGGSAFYGPYGCRSAVRYSGSPSDRGDGPGGPGYCSLIGLRVCSAPEVQ